jgi:hypothetical protein
MNASATIRRMNQTIVKKSQAPYDTPFNANKLPHVVDDTQGAVVVFDGWQNLPPQNLTPEEALDRAFKRSICIQRTQIRNRVVFMHPRLNTQMIVDKVIDPYVEQEKQDRRDRQGLTSRKSFLDETFDEESDED